jgi:hypothetical protein
MVLWHCSDGALMVLRSSDGWQLRWCCDIALMDGALMDGIWMVLVLVLQWCSGGALMMVLGGALMDGSMMNCCDIALMVL